MSTNRDKIKKDAPIISYIRCSTSEQTESGAGLQAQAASVRAHATRLGVLISRTATDEAVSGSLPPAARPALSEALAELARARGGMLIVSRTDRIARKASDLLQLVDLAERQGWQLVAVDGSIDTTTPHGRMLTTVMAAAAQLERDLVSARTREALQARRDAGARLGRPVTLAEPVRRRIAIERAAGRSMQAIADGLNADRVPTAAGRPHWYSASVASVLRSLEADAYAAHRLAS